MKVDKVDTEFIDGKIYFGLWFGTYFRLSSVAFDGDLEKNPLYQMAYNQCNSLPKGLLRGEEVRYKQIIVKPPYYSSPLIYWGTIGVKYVIWGRAFQVMKRLAKGVKRWKKMRRGGKIKWVRIDK